MNQLLKRPKLELSKVFKNEDTRFMLFTGLKVAGISLCINLFVYGCLFQVMRLNYAFFRAHGFPDFQDETVFYNYLLGEAMESFTTLFAFHIFLFFIGIYVGWIILRPFRIIGDYCEMVIANPNAVYKVDEFSTYKLLTRFSEFFFEYLRESRKKGEITTNSIPPQFSRIHKPVVDKVFMLHFGILLVIIGISSCLFIIENADGVFQNMIELASKTLSNSKYSNDFFTNQMFIMDDVVGLTIVLITVSYLSLGLHLYEKVSGAAFGIFSTMRAFMKGNYFSRVHLLGFAHVRENTRKLNKYLDYIQNNLEKPKPKG
jgi:hypothetical protein